MSVASPWTTSWRGKRATRAPPRARPIGLDQLDAPHPTLDARRPRPVAVAYRRRRSRRAPGVARSGWRAAPPRRGPRGSRSPERLVAHPGAIATGGDRRRRPDGDEREHEAVLGAAAHRPGASRPGWRSGLDQSCGGSGGHHPARYSTSSVFVAEDVVQDARGGEQLGRQQQVGLEGSTRRAGRSGSRPPRSSRAPRCAAAPTRLASSDGREVRLVRGASRRRRDRSRSTSSASWSVGTWVPLPSTKATSSCSSTSRRVSGSSSISATSWPSAERPRAR